MPYILHIETATRICSVGLSHYDTLIAIKEENNGQYSHSSSLTPFIEEVLKIAGIAIKNLDAVAVSMGPGSYTGLRIGVSSAKGLCFALDIPLIAVNTMAILAGLAKEFITRQDVKYYIPMIDARRMEVYSAIFDSEGQQVASIKAEIIDSNSFNNYLEQGVVVFCGDGAMKCRDKITHHNAVFLNDMHISAAGMPQLAYKSFTAKRFENLAYFEPFYLKDFVAGKPKVKGLE